jgi:hypothetical protein
MVNGNAAHQVMFRIEEAGPEQIPVRAVAWMAA